MSPARKRAPTRRTPRRVAKDLRLRISLNDIEPPIWREIVISNAATLFQLHRVMQILFEWYDYHLHMFVLGDRRFSEPRDDDADFGVTSENSLVTRLADLALVAGSTIRYDYDFGDSWEHTIEVVEVLPPIDTEGVVVAALIDGARAAPPEDCGGAPGYEDLLLAQKDPKHERHGEIMEWLGAPIDPDRFDLGAIRHALMMSVAWGAI
jgi:Plasmid pRiA4b ORF-3-like protein